jgi:hypothetical protein
MTGSSRSNADRRLESPLPQRPLLGPPGRGVHGIHRGGERSTHRGPTVRDIVAFPETRTIFLPRGALDRNPGAETRPRFGCRQSEFPVLLSIPRKKQIDDAEFFTSKTITSGGSAFGQDPILRQRTWIESVLPGLFMNQRESTREPAQSACNPCIG